MPGRAAAHLHLDPPGRRSSSSWTTTSLARSSMPKRRSSGRHGQPRLVHVGGGHGQRHPGPADAHLGHPGLLALHRPQPARAVALGQQGHRVGAHVVPGPGELAPGVARGPPPAGRPACRGARGTRRPLACRPKSRRRAYPSPSPLGRLAGLGATLGRRALLALCGPLFGLGTLLEGDHPGGWPVTMATSSVEVGGHPGRQGEVGHPQGGPDDQVGDVDLHRGRDVGRLGPHREGEQLLVDQAVAVVDLERLAGQGDRDFGGDDLVAAGRSGSRRG